MSIRWSCPIMPGVALNHLNFHNMYLRMADNTTTVRLICPLISHMPAHAQCSRVTTLTSTVSSSLQLSFQFSDPSSNVALRTAASAGPRRTFILQSPHDVGSSSYSQPVQPHDTVSVDPNLYPRLVSPHGARCATSGTNEKKSRSKR